MPAVNAGRSWKNGLNDSHSLRQRFKFAKILSIFGRFVAKTGVSSFLSVIAVAA
jgi:hypothetical protein